MEFNNGNEISNLFGIFHSKASQSNKIIPIIKDPYKIKDLISFLKSTEYDIYEKFELILKLYHLFNSNIILIPFFIKNCKRNNLNLLYESIFDIYLSEQIQRDKEEYLEKFLKLLMTNASLPKASPEYLCQNMSIFFNSDNKQVLNEELFMKYLNLLHLCYKDNSINEENSKIKSNELDDFQDIEINEKNNSIKNYIYFSGINSSLTLKLNTNSASPIVDFPNLENGISLVFWVNIDKEILSEYNTIYSAEIRNNSNPFQIDLVTLNIAEHKIKFILKGNNYFQIILDKIESNLMDISSVFNFGQWVNVCFIISKKAVMKSATIMIYINGLKLNMDLTIPKEFPTKIKINRITLFQNLIGRVSSFLFFSFPLSMKLINNFCLKMKNGIYKNKILFRFLIANDNNYFKNAIDYKYYEKYKHEKNKDKLLDILLKEQNAKNIISIFVPFTYNNRENCIDDIFGNYIAVLSKNDGVNNYINHIKNIQILGGINNLLPIAELMVKFKNTKNNIISEKSVIKYLNIFKDIIIEHNNNLYDANKNYFFSNLGLFLEKFPQNIFTEKILYILLDIGKEVFQYNDTININHNYNYNYINNILLNEKIFSKFSTENQVKLWDEVHKYFVSDYSKIKESLSIYKMCILLRFYDENRYSEYCCQKHANVIKITSKRNVKENNNIVTKNIMNPEMNVKTKKLFETIQIYMNKIGEDTVNLYKLLLLDLSPCLQIKIIQVYINYFLCNISEEKKEKTLVNLLKNNFFDISEYVLTISLLDVRTQILELIKIIFQMFRITIKHFFAESQRNLSTIFYYISSNLFLDQLNVEIDHYKKFKDDKDYLPIKKNMNVNMSITLRKRSISPYGHNKRNNRFGDSFYEKNIVHKDTLPLTKYLNKDIYEEEKNSLWRLISTWLIYEKKKNKGKNKNKNLKINNFSINFCVKFVSKNNIKYITDFMIFLIAYFNDESIANIKDLYNSNHLFSWIIETLFYFHNNENIKNMTSDEDKNNIANIQNKSIELLKIYIRYKNDSNSQIEQLVRFLLDYSIYIKSKVDEENIKDLEKNHKKNEISKITSMLLLICLEYCPKYIDFITKICFQFLVYYKNYKIKINNDNENINDNNTTNSNDDPNEDDDDSFEVVDKPLKKKNSIVIIDNNLNLNENNLGNNSHKFQDRKDSFIPYYILEGINYDPRQFESEDDREIKNQNRAAQSVILNNIIYLDEIKEKKNKIKKNVVLKEIWKDFAIYDFIIDYYYSNVWGLENLCKKVNILYDKPIEIIIQKLYLEYSQNKKYKNILSESIFECFNIKSNSENSKENKNININIINNININLNLNFDIKKKKKESLYEESINILTINLIIMSIAIEITNDQLQKDYLVNQYQQLLIFCILASINIKQSEKYYTLIQNELYNIIGYGCLFLKDKNEAKYQQILNYLINPLFREINEETFNKGFKKMLGFSKKKMYSNCAAFKVFSTKEKKRKSLTKTLTINSKSVKKKKSGILRSNSLGEISSINFNKFNFKTGINSDDQDDNTIKKAEESMDEDFALIDIKNDELKPELQLDKSMRIEAIYNTILEKYKKLENKISENFKKIINKNTNDELINKEKNAVFSEVKKLIPNYIEKLKKYSNNTYFIEKLRRNKYKKSKMQLFSWRGFWSNKYLFFTHPEYLKLKVKNHYTQEMIKPILTPVLDINYYLPNFKSFEKEKLFNKKNYKYSINLDIDEILKEEKTINNSINITNNKSLNTLKNIYGFNYLECLYKLHDKEIWDYYKLFYEQQLSSDKANFKKSETFIINLNTKKSHRKKKDKIINHVFQCCLVKILNHIKGYIKTRKNCLEFIYNEEEEDNLNMQEGGNNNEFQSIIDDEDDISYDKEMGCCYGSLFQKHKRDREKIYFCIMYEDIKYFFIKNYYYRDTSVEIFTENNKSYFFNFKTKNELFIFISDITNINNNNSNIKFRQIVACVHDDKEKYKLLGYEKLLPSMKNKSYVISNKTEEWQNYNISTLEYLMWLNIYSGRSFNDLNQYPVFPWIITNYSSKTISNKDYRNLSTPIGMLEFGEKSINRKNQFIVFYETLKGEFESNYPDIDYVSFINKGQEYLTSYKKKRLKMMKKDKNQIFNNENFDIPYNQIPYNYGTHYSNPTYVSHFLSRIFPFSFVSIEIHGNKFDDPDRMFFSMEKTFESITTLKDDIREIIPEFYFLPEMFNNINNLNLAQNKIDSEGNEIIINNVALPPWSNGNPVDFVLEKRKYLEGDIIPINKWIDIIFGSYQRGENAEKINNLYLSYTYEKMTKIMEINDYDQRAALLRLYETGVTPRLIFKNDSKTRIEKSIFVQKNTCSNLKFLEDSLSLDKSKFKMIKYNLLSNTNKNNEYVNKTINQIISIKIVSNHNLKIFTNTNKYFNLQTKKEKKEKKEKKDKKDKKEANEDKENICSIENTSSIYAANYQISSIQTPIIVYNSNKLMIKGGFWDGRLELNSIQADVKEDKVSSMIFPGYGQPIVCMKMSKDEKLLVCGTKDGAVIIYDVNGKNLTFKDIIYSHNDEITSICINENLNMLATSSVDGYIMLYTTPTFRLVRAIHISSLKQKNEDILEDIQNKNIINNINGNEEEKININMIIESGNNEAKKDENNIININKIIENDENKNIENIQINKINIEDNNLFNEEPFEEYKNNQCSYADYVLLSSNPLPCIVVYICQKRVFRSYSINGNFINEIEETEDSSKIFSPIIYKNLNFNEFLIYGTNNGYIKLRDFPKMNLLHSIKVCDDCIKTLTLSNDKKYCYAWGQGDILNIISDNIISEFQEI